MRSKTLNNKGVALLTVVLYFLVLVILLAGVMFATVTNLNNAVVSKEHTSAYYAAESGLNLTIQKLEKYLVDNNYAAIPPAQFTTKMNQLNTYILGLNGQTGTLSGIDPQGTYTIQTSSPSAKTYTIRATGVVEDVTRIVEGTFSFENINADMAKAIIAKSSITTKSGASIEGPIASLLDPAGSVIDIECNGSSTTKINEIFYPSPLPAGSYVDIENKCAGTKTAVDVNEVITFNDYSLPTYYNITDTYVDPNDGLTKPLLVTITPVGNTYTFPTLLAGQKGYYIPSLPSNNVTFNLGTGSTSSIFSLFVGDLNVINDSTLNVGDIDVTGNGKLKILMQINKSDFAKNDNLFLWDGNANYSQSLLTNPDISKLQLVIKKGTGFTTNPTFGFKNTLFLGSLMMDQINVEIGNIDYRGFIATKGDTINITSTAEITGPMWIYAPNADVMMKSNGVINGSIIAKSVTFESGATLKFKTYSGTLPPEITLPLFAGGEPVPVGITFKFSNFKEV